MDQLQLEEILQIYNGGFSHDSIYFSASIAYAKDKGHQAYSPKVVKLRLDQILL